MSPEIVMSNTSAVPNLVGTVELSRLLGVSICTVRRWLDEGRLPQPIKLRRNYHVWPIDAVQHLLDERTSPAPAAAGAC